VAIGADSTGHPDNLLSAALGECSSRDWRTWVRFPAPPPSRARPCSDTIPRAVPSWCP